MISILSNVTPGATANPARSVAGWLTGWVQGLLRGLLRELLRREKRRAAIKALRQLDDRELRDIGLSRGQIEAAVCGFARAEAELAEIRMSASGYLVTR
jgi:uncharacterized protein YjiS (DUF1127 family)